MCGINIILSKNDNLGNELKLMNSLLHHRGPDNTSEFHSNNISIGHTRLSIIDTSENAHQPKRSKDKNLVISFNGEIYNYKELSSNYNLKADNECELLLQLFSKLRSNMFEKLNGIFAITIYDISKRELYISRDQFGIKPLYYLKTNSKIYISSEIKPINACSKQNISKESELIFDIFGFLPTPLTLYENIFSFEKAHYYTINLDDFKIKKRRYYSPVKTENQTYSPSTLRDILMKSIHRQHLSDVEICTFLSGGVDSSILTLLANKTFGSVNTISIDFEDKKYSEKKYQQLVTSKIKGSIHTEVITYEKFKKLNKYFLNNIDTPSIDGFNTFVVSKIAKSKNYKVALSGLGADEIFLGYKKKILLYKSGLFLNKHPRLRRLLKKTFKLIKPDLSKKLDFLDVKGNIGIFLFMRGVGSIENAIIKHGIDRENIIKLLETLNQYTTNTIKLKNTYTKYSILELDLYLEGQLLRDVDHAGMLNSLEIRVPFLDIELVNYIFSLKKSLKIKGRTPKPMLTIPFLEIIPHQLMYRKKMGFEFPLNSWSYDLHKEEWQTLILKKTKEN